MTQQNKLSDLPAVSLMLNTVNILQTQYGSLRIYCIYKVVRKLGKQGCTDIKNTQKYIYHQSKGSSTLQQVEIFLHFQLWPTFSVLVLTDRQGHLKQPQHKYSISINKYTKHP